MVPQVLKAQSIFRLNAGNDVSIKVLGSSNVHDWVMTSVVMESLGDFKFDASNQLRSLSAFGFSLDAKSLKSEHESMDNRTYKTINADKYPKIVYKLSSAAISEIQKNKFLIKTTGNLTISGTTQTIMMDVTAVVNADKTITCTGSQKIKLTDFKIDPPSFLLGAMKVANDLTIQFNLVYKNSQLISQTN
jgi:polyisoprenoid-binding protein YceI